MTRRKLRGGWDTLNRGMLAVFASLALMLAIPAHAQFSSTVEGTVSDATGAVLSDATVTLTNADTNVAQTTKSDSTGSYHFPNIAPGRYKVEANASGFQSAVQDNV